MEHFNVAKEELSFYGADNTSLQNILAVMIGPKADPEVTGRLAGLGIQRLVEMSMDELKQYKGIGEASARRIISGFGLANQIRKYQKEKDYVITSPESAAEYFEDMEYRSQEFFEVIYLNAKNVVIGRKNIFKGSLNMSVVHPREILKEAVKLSAARFVAAHNHPSGDPNPSEQDYEVTARLVEASHYVGVELLDHIIIGQGKYFSFKENEKI